MSRPPEPFAAPRRILASPALLLALVLAACAADVPSSEGDSMTSETRAAKPSGRTAEAVIGGGCFWCVEAVFERVEGVLEADSGYAGGTVASPTYEAVCRGDTGHAEVVRVRYDPAVLTYEDLLRIFLATHDPTTPNRQGADVGPQYRSIILVAGDEERRAAEAVLAEAQAEIAAPIVTEIVELDRFWPAEIHHQEYFERNPNQGYCRAVIAPKIAKFEKTFRDRLKTSR